MKTHLDATEAARTILANVSRLEAVSVAVAESVSRVLAADVISPVDIPPWANSAMDGYAVRSADDLTVGTILPIEQEIRAGTFPGHGIRPGTCCRVFTGAPVPQDCDTVIRQEDVTAQDGQSITINDLRDLHRNVRQRAEDISLGEIVFHTADVITPASLGVLVSIAQSDIRVFRQPRVAILASGDEIVDLDQRDAVLAGKKIASSNTYALTALIQEAGGIPVNLGIARDDPAELRAHILRATDCDLLVTTAGVSVGEHDYLRGVLAELGLSNAFWRIRMRPGAPVGFGTIDTLGNMPWIGLPGNPVSTMVTFELFARPAIRRMLGHANPFRRTQRVRVAEDIALGPKLQHFLRVKLTDAGAKLTGPQGSGILTSMARADALLVVPTDCPMVSADTECNAIVLDDPRHVADVPW